MGYFARRIVEGKEQLGSDNAVVAGNIKTLNGMRKRLERTVNLPKGLWHIYSFFHFYDDNTFVLRGTFNKK